MLNLDIGPDDVITNKKQAIKSLNNLLEFYINDPTKKYLKKATLLSYWIKDYVKMINFEETFEPKRNISYKRGNIIKLNFGFNIGSEYGGLHYAIVLDNNNAHNCPTVTVIPLTSIKPDGVIHKNSVHLGNELYRLLKIKYDTTLKSLKDEQKELDEAIVSFKILVDTTKKSFDQIKTINDPEIQDAELDKIRKCLDSADKIDSFWKEKQKHNQEQQVYLNKIGNEINHMQQGSIALVNQITTISKIRIFDPKNLKGVLSGISLSEESMDKINQKVKELYIF